MLSHHQKEVDLDRASSKKTKLGVYFFFVYLFFYAGFVLIGVFNYELLSLELFGGINLAVLYGIGLIFFAVIMGILYNYFCSKYEDEEKAYNKSRKEYEI